MAKFLTEAAKWAPCVLAVAAMSSIAWLVIAIWLKVAIALDAIRVAGG